MNSTPTHDDLPPTWLPGGRIGPWLLVGGWYALIFFLSQAPGTDNESSARLLDRLGLADVNGLARMLAHLTVFGVLGVLVVRALGGGRLRLTPRLALATLAIAGVLAVLDEVHQHFVPWRHGRALDVGFDLLGVVLALALVALWPRLRGRSPAADVAEVGR